MSTWDCILKVREGKPLVHCYTNAVASNYAANALISSGASPMMAAEPLEAQEMTSIADALSVNIGTLTPQTAKAMHISAETARERAIPWVLDPVGVGASQLRKDTCRALVALKPTIIRGNASEIAFLSELVLPKGEGTLAARGVDSTIAPEDAVAPAKRLARITGGVVVVSGAVDWITDGATTLRCVNGHPKMAEVTATGCAISALLGAFVAVAPENPVWAAAHGMVFYGVAGELAAAASAGTGSMASELLDRLGSISSDEFKARARPLVDLSLYLVTDPKLLRRGMTVLDVVESALSSGKVGVVQLREKDIESGEFYTRAVEVKKTCDRYGVPLIINDRLDIALAVDAAGLHIGQKDIPVPVARKLLGKNKILGLSVGSVDEMKTAHAEGWDVDYFGTGPVYDTNTKATGRPELRPEGLAEIIQYSKRPVVAIGGLKLENISSVSEEVTGAAGVAVVTAITLAEDPKQTSVNLLKAFRSSHS